jgi:hypothetical protein
MFAVLIPVLILVSLAAILLRDEEAVSHHQPTVGAPGTLHLTDSESEPVSDPIPPLAERGEIRPNELPVGVRSNSGMAFSSIERVPWQPDCSSLGSPVALLSTV